MSFQPINTTFNKPLNTEGYPLNQAQSSPVKTIYGDASNSKQLVKASNEIKSFVSQATEHCKKSI